MIDKAHAAGIESMLSQIRQYQSNLNPPANPMVRPPSIDPTDLRPAPDRLATGIQEAGAPLPKPTFGQVVQRAVGGVNEAQQTARELSTAYDRGEDVPLTDVVIAMQKSSLAFEATLQVRNKVLKAYEDIMNMPV
jgi:flagellar hook-basal body complex protein FliE